MLCSTTRQESDFEVTADAALNRVLGALRLPERGVRIIDMARDRRGDL
jgi:hypothetical protein